MSETAALDPEEILNDADLEAAVPAEPDGKKKPKFDPSITEGPLTRAVWKIAWPAVLTNLVSGAQGWVDQILVGNLIGYQANAAIGVGSHLWRGQLRIV